MKKFTSPLETYEYHTAIGVMPSSSIMNNVRETTKELSVGDSFSSLSPDNKKLVLDSLRGDLARLTLEESEKFLNNHPEVKEFLDKNPE